MATSPSGVPPSILKEDPSHSNKPVEFMAFPLHQEISQIPPEVAKRLQYAKAFLQQVVSSGTAMKWSPTPMTAAPSELSS